MCARAHVRVGGAASLPDVRGCDGKSEYDSVLLGFMFVFVFLRAGSGECLRY